MHLLQKIRLKRSRDWMLRAIYSDIRRRLQCEIEARWIIEQRTDYTWSDLISNPGALLSDDQIRDIEDDVQRRLAGEPLTRIYSEAEFWGLRFGLAADTLDPRPETELVIELALKRFDKKRSLRILDLGTGSGCILIALLSEFSNALGFGVDLSFGALAQARENAKLNQVEGRAHLMCGNWLEAIDSDFDLIVSNPPYIASQEIPSLSKEVSQHDPILALDGGADGLAPYKIIFPEIKNILNRRGIAFFEIGYDQEKDVMRLAEDSGFVLRCVHPDLAGNPRVVEISYGDK